MTTQGPESVQNSFMNALRKKAKFSCPISGCQAEVVDAENQAKQHISQYHPELLEHKTISEASREWRREPSPAPRSRARLRDEFDRTTQVGKLLSPSDSDPSSRRIRGHRNEHTEPLPSTRLRPTSSDQDDLKVSNDPDADAYIPRPKTRPIDHLQLVAEVKGIYAGLVMVESKCIEVDNPQKTQIDAKLNNEQWQALIELHRALLHEHHDFFLASQYPTASSSLRRLGKKYYMPGRMWKHGKHASDSVPNTSVSELQVLASKRRGRGARRNTAYWKSRIQDPMVVGSYHALRILAPLTEILQDFFEARDCLFEDSNGKLLVPALADLDSKLKSSRPTDDLIMSATYAKQIGRYDDISTEFEDPGLLDVSGQQTPMRGILKDVAFRLKGCSTTFRRDFYVSDLVGNGALAGADIVFGAKFMRDHFAMLFQRLYEGAISVSTGLKSMFIQAIDNSSNFFEAQLQALLNRVRSGAGNVSETASSACSGSGSWAVWGSKKKQDAKERKEREKREEEQRQQSARLESRRLELEAAVHGNNAGPHGQGPIGTSGSPQASSSPR
ncbi:hypothetical protein PG993_014416 [Apiospora rasikravindrae]|uniref:C2H2-type domain-containing protein n=1 Tax=Apiospora rasikravindrae TaxID=990691 RepID=A0ABR1RN03_9PEZI